MMKGALAGELHDGWMAHSVYSPGSVNTEKSTNWHGLPETGFEHVSAVTPVHMVSPFSFKMKTSLTVSCSSLNVIVAVFS